MNEENYSMFLNGFQEGMRCGIRAVLYVVKSADLAILDILDAEADDPILDEFTERIADRVRELRPEIFQ